MKRFWQLLVLGYVAFAVPATVSAQILGLNFASTDPDAATSALASHGRGRCYFPCQLEQPHRRHRDGCGKPRLRQQRHVHSEHRHGQLDQPQHLALGRTTINCPVGPQRKLMSGYIDTGNTAADGYYVTVNNIDAALRATPYDVYVYFVSDSNANRGGGYTLTPTAARPS